MAICKFLNSRAVNFTLRRNMFSLFVSHRHLKSLEKKSLWRLFHRSFKVRGKVKKKNQKKKKERERNKIKHAWEVVVFQHQTSSRYIMDDYVELCLYIVSLFFQWSAMYLSLYNEMVAWWITAPNKRKNHFPMNTRIFLLWFYSSNP